MSDSAAERLERILYILPAAHRPGGARIEELASTLGVDVGTIIADLQTVTEREYYHPGGSTDPMCMRIVRGRVVLDAGGEFARPVRLNRREGIAVHMALLTLAAECDVARRARVLDLASRIAADLVAPEIETVHAMREVTPSYALAPELEYEPQEERALLLGLGADTVRGVLGDAIEDARTVRLQYLKAGATAPELRHVTPQQLVYAEGRWYLMGYDLDRRDTRIFRLDRMLSAAPAEPAGAEALEREWIDRVAERGAAYFAEEDVEVMVRYSPAIARWIAERSGVVPEADGSVLLRHRVADPRWLVRHVLQFAGDAWIEQPEEMRAAVAVRALELSA